MAARLISSSIPNLLNGVSQQADTVRLPNQFEIQENGLSDVVFGLGKRPPTEHIAKLSNATNTNSKIHIINRDAVEQYVLVLTNGGAKIYDLAGVEKTIVAPSGFTYLNSTNPVLDFNIVSVADYTFIVNKTVTVTKSGTLTAVRPAEALYFVKNGQYKTTYTIKIDGVEKANYQTLDNSNFANQSSVTTDNIATELYNDLISAGAGLTANYTITRDGSIIHVKKNTGTFTTDVTDGLGGNGLILVKDKINNFEDLPYKGVVDFTVEIAGNDGSQYDNYFVKWTGTSWTETVKSGIDNSINTAKLPHLLIRTADGNFRFTPANGSSYTISGNNYSTPLYNSRTCGDDTTAPDPSFIGNKISDVFFYRNRLGILSNENVVFSKSGEFFTFYPETVTTVLDDDAIDISVSHNRVSQLKYAVALNEELLLFSDQTQFLLKPEEILTAKTVSINQATEHEVDAGCQPISIGQNVYFAFKRGQFSGCKEYFLSVDLQTKDALDTTINIPRYIKGNIYSLRGSTTENTVLAFATGERNVIHVYKFYFDNQNKALQRSWSKYIFPSGDVCLDGAAIENYFYLVIKRADGTYLEKINLKTNEVDNNLNFPVLLDRKALITGVYDANTNLTTWTTPYPSTEVKSVVLSGAWNDTMKGRNIIINSSTSTTVSATGNYTAASAYVGLNYNFKFKFSTFYLREQKSSGNASTISTGRLQLKKINLIFADSGFFKVTLTPRARTSSLYVFTGQILGSSAFILGQPVLESGEFKIPVQCRNLDVEIEINSDNYLPCNFLSAEWQGLYSTISGRSSV